MTRKRFGGSIMNEQHPDYAALAKIRDGIFALAGGVDKLRQELPILIKNANGITLLKDEVVALRS